MPLHKMVQSTLVIVSVLQYAVCRQKGPVIDAPHSSISGFSKVKFLFLEGQATSCSDQSSCHESHGRLTYCCLFLTSAG